MKLCDFEVGLDHPLFLMAGPCVIESEQMALDVAAELRDICTDLAIPFIYKSSFDKANRSSTASFRGLGRTSSPSTADTRAAVSGATRQRPLWSMAEHYSSGKSRRRCGRPGR